MSNQQEQQKNRAQDPSDEKLVAEVHDGCIDAFDQLVRRYQRKASAVAYRLLSNRDDAAEVTQDAFLKAYDRLDSLDQPERFGPWLLRIVSNLALNKRRGRALRRHASLDQPVGQDEKSPAAGRADPHMATPLQQAEGADLRHRLREEIDKLPELQRRALVLFSIEKLPQKQVAEILDCSVEAVKWHVFTARKKLKAQLEGLL